MEVRPEQLGLPDADGPAVAAADREPPPLLFATNRQNLLEVLSSGVIAPIESYDKYYDDLLRFCPGNIPFLSGPVSDGVQRLITDPEDPGSFPVVIELRADVPTIQRLSTPSADAPVRTVRGAVALRDATFHFRSRSELEEHLSGDYENLSHRRDRYVVSPHLFDGGGGDAVALEQALRAVDIGPAEGEDVYRRADRLAGAGVLLAHVATRHPAALAGYAAALGGSPIASGGDDPWPAWLRFGALGGEVVKGEDGEHRAWRGLVEAFSALERSTGFRPLDLFEAARRSALLRRPRKADAHAINQSFEKACAVLDNSADFTLDDPEVPLSSVRGALYAVLRSSPGRLISFIDEEQPEDLASVLAAAALVGLANGRKRMDTTLRPPRLDAYFARRVEDDSVQRPTSPLGVAVVDRGGDGRLGVLSAGGAWILEVALPPATLFELFSVADIESGPAKRAAMDLATTMGWDDCLHSVLFLPLGVESVRYSEDRKMVGVEFLGVGTLTRRVPKDAFLTRLEGESIPDHVRIRIMDLLSSQDGRPEAPGSAPEPPSTGMTALEPGDARETGTKGAKRG